jgi:hypothetical protein
MPDMQHLSRDPVAGTKVKKGERERTGELVPTGDDSAQTDAQTQAQRSEQAFDRALTRLPPG